MKFTSLITTGFLALLVSSAYAQITGPTPTYAGSTQQYSWTGGTLSNPVWQFGNGTKVSQTGNSVTVTWSTGVTSGAVILMDGSTFKGTLNVYLKPVAPSISAATSVTSNSFTANWGSSSTATSYRLDVSTGSSFSSFVSGYNNLSVSGTSQSVSGLAVGTYYYRVRAVNSSGDSQNSATSSPVVVALGYPAITVTLHSYSLDLAWSAVPGATTYFLDVSTDGGFSNMVSGYNALAVSGITKVVDGLRPSMNYWIRMKSFDGSIYSSYSPSSPKTTLDQFATINENYIVVDNIQIQNVTSQTTINTLPRDHDSQTVQYFDGLGRPVQTVTTGGSPLKKDIIQPIAYDAYGREAIKYLPYTATGTSSNTGWIKASPFTEQVSFYTNTSKVATDPSPYAVTIYEPSPLNRVLKQGAPGTSWQPNTDPNSLADNTIKKRYEFNATNDVLLWSYNSATNTATAKDGSGVLQYYTANQLYANKTYDEANRVVIEYVDKEGRTVLKRVQADDNVTPTFANTYYIYDDFGNLVMVLPPEAVKALTN